MPDPIQLNDEEKAALEAANMSTIVAKAMVYNAQIELEKAQDKVRAAQDNLAAAQAEAKGAIKTLSSLHGVKGGVRVSDDLSSLITE